MSQRLQRVITFIQPTSLGSTTSAAMNRTAFSTSMKPKMPQDGISGFTSAVESAIIASPNILRLMMLNHIVRRRLLIEARTDETSRVIAQAMIFSASSRKGPVSTSSR